MLAHTCTPSKCPHCNDNLIDEGHHRCYIKPLKVEEHDEKYIYFDFETMYEQKHTANYVCAISQEGEVFTAEGVDCVDQMIKHFRRPKFADFTFIAHKCGRFRFLYIARVFHKSGIDAENHTPRMQARIYVRSYV